MNINCFFFFSIFNRIRPVECSNQENRDDEKLQSMKEPENPAPMVNDNNNNY